MPRRASLRQVASLAHVSPSTISRYLRGELALTAETESRINAAMTEVGYQPAEPQEADSPSGSIGLVVPNFTNPFFASLAQQFTSIAEGAGLQTLVIRSGGRHEEDRIVARLLDSRPTISALAYGGMSEGSRQFARAIDMGLPVVAIDEQFETDTPIDTITVDNYSGAYEATAYLISLGHRRIAFIGGPLEFSTTHARLRGYSDALARAGIAEEPALIQYGFHTERFGASVFPRLLGLADPPTAIFATSDVTAVGILSAAEIHGLVIPSDLSVVGFDGIRMAQWLRPKLTTVEQPVEALAQAAVVAIMRQLQHASAGDHAVRYAPRDVVLPMRLVIRGSTAAPSSR